MLVPVVVALVVLAKVLGGNGGGDAAADPGPADIEGTTAPGRAELPPLPVEVPPVTPEATRYCPTVMGDLPLELAGEPTRPVQSDSPFAAAWGEPAVVLVCGVERPEGWVVAAPAIEINGVQWYVDTDDPETTVWTTVDRPVYVEVTLPGGVDSAPVTALTLPLAQALPYTEPDPGD